MRLALVKFYAIGALHRLVSSDYKLFVLFSFFFEINITRIRSTILLATSACIYSSPRPASSRTEVEPLEALLK